MLNYSKLLAYGNYLSYSNQFEPNQIYEPLTGQGKVFFGNSDTKKNKKTMKYMKNLKNIEWELCGRQLIVGMNCKYI